MNTEKRKTSDLYRLVFYFTGKRDLRRGYKRIALSNLSIYYTSINIKKSYGINKSKISGTTWDEEFKLLNGSYCV